MSRGFSHFWVKNVMNFKLNTFSCTKEASVEHQEKEGKGFSQRENKL